MNTSNWRKISCCQVWNLLSQKWSFYCSSIIITWMKWYHGRSTAAPIKKNGIPFIKLLAKPKSRELVGSSKKSAEILALLENYYYNQLCTYCLGLKNNHLFGRAECCNWGILLKSAIWELPNIIPTLIKCANAKMNGIYSIM